MKMLFYPQMPKSFSKLTHVCKALGIQIVDIPCNHDVSDISLGIHWNYQTICPADDLLKLLAKQLPIINLRVNNLSKSYVEKLFSRIFGYSSFIDPSTSYGYCVEKSERQAAHDFKIIRLPAPKKEGFIYQKLLDSRSSFSHFEELRIVIFKNTIPFIFIKSKQISNPIKGFDNATLQINPNFYLSENEQFLILRFSSEFGLDYGEIDIIRNNSDGRIYILDVNNMPGDQLFRKLPVWDIDKVKTTYANSFSLNFIP